MVDRVVHLLRGPRIAGQSSSRSRYKVGHAGTLDPLATGVLVVCVGAATRLIEYVQRMPKTYRTTILLGATSDTLDADGRIIAKHVPRRPEEDEIRMTLRRQVGTIDQRPPEFSALKVQGRRAYDLARAGQTVELPARPVRIDRIELLGYAWPELTLEIDCGGGTYIRSIARDLGEDLGCGGLVSTLRRTRIGPFHESDAIDPATLTRVGLVAQIQPAVAAVADLPQLVLDAAELAAILQGRSLPNATERIGREIRPGEVALIGPDGSLVAIAEFSASIGQIAPRRVLTTALGNPTANQELRELGSND